jgi:tetratricopeptide (TPR) repeat protein
VHRDLKPDNVALRPGGLPVILDFGLATRVAGPGDREELAAAAAAAGSLPYMSPEQCQGEVVDARSDLYSLGCILHELLCGRPPFLAARPVEALWHHLSTPPAPPSSLAPGIPRDVDALVLALLAKDPRRRPGYADVVAARLLSSGAEEGTPGGPEARPYLYRAGLAGRDAVLDRGRAAVDRLGRGDGGLMLVIGETGLGKTRVLQELAREARRRGIAVVTGGSDPGGAAPLGAFRPLLQHVADRCSEAGPRGRERILGAHGPVLGPFEPRLRPAAGPWREPPSLPPDAARDRICGALVATVSAAHEKRPVLFLADDLHDADALSLQVLAQLHGTGRLHAAGWLVVGSHRPEEAPPLLRELARHAPAMPLPKLEGPALAKVAREMLAAPDLPEEVAQVIAARGEGNPFFVAEALRAAVDGGLLRRGADGGWRTADGPGSGARWRRLAPSARLGALVRRRVAILGEEAVAAARAAAVLGASAGSDLVASVAGMERRALRPLVHELVARSVLESDGAAYRFVHDVIRAELVRATSARERRHLHRRAAAAIERLPSRERARWAGALPAHWEAAGAESRARAAYLQAAREAVRVGALHDAAGLYGGYLRLRRGSARERVAVARELAERALHARGESAAAVRVLRRALREARDLGSSRLEAGVRHALGVVLDDTGQREPAERQIGRALAMSAAPGFPAALRARILTSSGYLHRSRGRPLEAIAAMEAAMEIGRRSGDRAVDAVVAGNLAMVYKDQGDLRRAEELGRRCVAGVRAARLPSLGSALSNLATVLELSGRVAEGEKLRRRALQVHRDAGHRRAEASALGLLAVCHFVGGKPAEALGELARAIAIHDEVGDPFHAAIALGHLAVFSREMGDRGEARRAAERAMKLTRLLGNAAVEADVLLRRALLDLDDGRTRQAARLARRAARLASRVGHPALGALARRTEALVLLEEGDAARARALLEGALGVLCRSGAVEVVPTKLLIARALRLLGRLDEAAGCLAEVRDAVWRGERPLERARVLVEEALLARARGEDPGPRRAEATEILARLGVGPEAPVSRALQASAAGPMASAFMRR